MIIDGHRHLAGDPEAIIREMDALGIDRTVLVGVGVKDLSFVSVRWSPVFRSHLLTWALGSIKGAIISRRLRKANQLLEVPGNGPVLAAIRQYPDRFYGFAFINPGHPDALVEAKRCLDNGMRGLKFALLQYPAPITGSVMHELCSLAEEYRVPVFIHIGILHSTYCFEELVRDFPAVHFIIAHAGAQRFWRSLLRGKDFDNVFFDLSSYYVTVPKMRQLLRTVGPRKLLFGSDVPVMADSPSQALAMIRSLGLSVNDEQAILGENLGAFLKDKN